MSRLDPRIPSSEMDDVDDDGGGTVADSSLGVWGNLTMPPEQRRHLEAYESSFRVDESLDEMNGARRGSSDDDITGNVLDSLHDQSSSPAPRTADTTDDSLFPQRLPHLNDRSRMPPPLVPASELRTKQSFIGSRSSSPFQDQPGNINLFSSDAATDEDQDQGPEPPSSPTPTVLSMKKKRSESPLKRAKTPAERARTPAEGQEERTKQELKPESRPQSRAPSREPSRPQSRAPTVTDEEPLDAPAPSGMPSNNVTTRKKGKFLSTRHSSSGSVSSMQSMGDDDDSGVNANNSNVGMGQRMSLSRTASLGSIASGITSLANRNSLTMGTASERALARLDEEEQKSAKGELEDEGEDEDEVEGSEQDVPHTPTNRSPQKLPTDTAIAKRVGNIEVPPTVARDYRSRFPHLAATPGPASPTKRNLQTPVPGAPVTRTMTLKEQSTTIDRLQKENFDLKIKVYYLQERIDKSSEEGIHEIMQENVEFKIKNTELLRSNKQLKKEIRELQQKLDSQQVEEKGDLEDEVLELKETIEEYRIEIETMRERERRTEEEMKQMRERDAQREQSFKRMRSSASSAGGINNSEFVGSFVVRIMAAADNYRMNCILVSRWK